MEEIDIKRLKNKYNKFIESENLYNEKNFNILRKDVHYLKNEIENAFITIINDNYSKEEIKELKVLEIGTAWGQRLRSFIDMGFAPENLYGIDLMEHFINEAKKLSSNKMNFLCGDAQKMNFENNSFDIIFQCIALSSILDSKIKKNICTEMKRLLKSNGIIIWIDSSLKNYKTEDDGEVYFKSISKEELESYFIDCKVEWYSNIYLKPFYATCCRRMCLQYILYLFNKKILKKEEEFNKCNEFLKFIFNKINHCKSHTVAVISKT